MVKAKAFLVGYRSCLGVNFATREEDVNQRRIAVWLDSIRPRDLVFQHLACNNLDIPKIIASQNVCISVSCPPAAQDYRFGGVGFFIVNLHTFVVPRV